MSEPEKCPPDAVPEGYGEPRTRKVVERLHQSRTAADYAPAGGRPGTVAGDSK